MTGVGITAQLHWLNASGPSSFLAEIVTCASALWGEPELKEHGGCTYQRHYRWASGAVLFFSDGRKDCLLSVNGAAVDAVEPIDQLRLMKQLHGYQFRTTRIDAAVNDWERVVPLEVVHGAAEVGDFCGFKLTQGHQPKVRVGDSMQLTGDMRTFGRRGRDGSGAYYRVYDKLLETKGEIDCIRWEVEFCDEKAHEVGRRLADCDDVESFVRLLAELVGGNIDFRRRGHEVHVDRRPVLSWWSSFLAKIGAAKVSVRRLLAPLQAAAKALHRQYSGVMAQLKVVCDGAGVDFFSHLRAMIDDACSMLDPRKLDGRDLCLNLTEAFGLRRRSAVFVPAAVARDWAESLPF